MSAVRQRIVCAARRSRCPQRRAPLALVAPGGFSAGTSGAAVAHSAIFQPWQVWWFLGSHGALVHGLFGVLKPGYRTGPAWSSAISHPLIVAVGLVLAAALWLQSRRRTGTGTASERDALLMLALILLLRCVLDTWDTGYYDWGSCLRCSPGRPSGVARVRRCSHWRARCSRGSASSGCPCTALADLQAALFLAWTLPLAAGLALRLYAPDLVRGITTGAARRRHAARPTADIGAPAGSQPA